MNHDISTYTTDDGVTNFSIRSRESPLHVIASITFTINNGEIRTLYVDQVERRKGLGSLLLSLAENDLKRNGLNNAFLLAYPIEQDESCTNIQKWYTKRGYSSISHYWNPFKSNYFKKELK